MRTNLEREFDGMVARMLSWLAHPPTRSLTLSRPSGRIEEPDEPRLRAVADEVAATTAERVVQASKPAPAKPSRASKSRVEKAAKKPAAKARQAVKAAEVLIEDGLDLDSAAKREPGESGELEEKLLAALAEAPDGASMRQLQRATGAKPYAARQRLNQLMQAGRVERKGKGMRTQYHLAER